LSLQVIRKILAFQMKIHFIAIGGSAMHNLAIALHKKGFYISGSDDEIFEPAKSNLSKYNLLPSQIGWFPEKITNELDAVILGMHARADNPELLAAQELGIKIFSYPEYLYEATKNKTRVVIGGSHGKTTTTAMIMHVLKENNIDFDYMVGAALDGFETMVKLTDSAKIAVFEGDEYLTSPIDLRPKFHLYNPNIALISGIAWDHINVFPTFENYMEQFKIFVDKIEPNGTLIYFNADENLQTIANLARSDIKKIAYTAHESEIVDDKTFLKNDSRKYLLQIFGNHNLENISGAKNVCNQLGLTDEQFYNAIATFNGAAKRLQVLSKSETSTVFLDFAHSPSKLAATTKAVKEQFANRKLIACMELHTFSSLNKDFLPQYDGTLNTADIAYVYYNPQTIEHKKLPAISLEQVLNGFGRPDLKIFTDSDLLFDELLTYDWQHKNLLLMSSGNFSGKDLKKFAQQIMQE